MTDPSARIAAKAPLDALMQCTPTKSAVTDLQSPPRFGSPQVTTLPLLSIAAKAPLFPWICCTSRNCSWTWRLSPPWLGWSQDTTDPSFRTAAKAPSVAWMCHTSCNSSMTWLLSPPEGPSPQVMTRPSPRTAANAFMEASTICTSVSSSCTALLSPPQLGMPQLTTLPSLRMRAKAVALWLGTIHALRRMALMVSPFWSPASSKVHDPFLAAACRWLKHIQTRHNLILLIYFYSQNLSIISIKNRQESFKNLAKVYIRIYRRRKNEKWWKM